MAEALFFSRVLLHKAIFFSYFAFTAESLDMENVRLQKFDILTIIKQHAEKNAIGTEQQLRLFLMRMIRLFRILEEKL